MKFNQLTPEFAVSDIAKSKAFYCGLLGFQIKFERPKEGFAFLVLGDVQIMLDQIDLGRTFGENLNVNTLGAGVNLQIFVDDAQQREMLQALNGNNHQVSLELEEKWYRIDDVDVCQRQFVVADPDGYLLRFAAKLGSRTV